MQQFAFLYSSWGSHGKRVVCLEWFAIPSSSEEESGKAGLKLNIKKTKIMASGPITLWQWKWKSWKQSSQALKSLRMVTATMKLEENYFLERKLWQL